MKNLLALFFASTFAFADGPDRPAQRQESSGAALDVSNWSRCKNIDFKEAGVVQVELDTIM